MPGVETVNLLTERVGYSRRQRLSGPGRIGRGGVLEHLAAGAGRGELRRPVGEPPLGEPGMMGVDPRVDVAAIRAEVGYFGCDCSHFSSRFNSFLTLLVGLSGLVIFQTPRRIIPTL